MVQHTLLYPGHGSVLIKLIISQVLNHHIYYVMGATYIYVYISINTELVGLPYNLKYYRDLYEERM